MKACRFILTALVLTIIPVDTVKGVVEISPSVVAPVCQVRDQLEVTCTISGVLQQWQLIGSGVVTQLLQVSSAGSTGVQSEPLIIESIMFTASRLSDQGSSPLISRMIINPVSRGLNGSEVNCVDTLAYESARTIILIIGDTPPARPSIQSHSEEFSSDRVIAYVEWMLSNPLGRYQQLLLPNISINIVPDTGVDPIIRNMSVQLALPYNTLYNVSVAQPGICGQHDQTAFIELNYPKCYNPGLVITADLIIEGYEDPALEGENITFSCHDGLMLIGPTLATCMGNGEWEPNPGNATCTGGETTALLVTTGASILHPILWTTSDTKFTINMFVFISATCSNPLYVLQIKDSPVGSVDWSPRSELNMTPMCCSGFLITKPNMTTCLENGEWELETSQMKNEGVPDPSVATLRTALISVTCVLVMLLVLTFIIGFVCGHYFSQGLRKPANNNDGSPPDPTTEHRGDLELKENIAYITVTASKMNL